MLGARAELPVAEATPHALVLPFDFDSGSVDPTARAAFEFLYEALRRHFIAPALQTSSTEEFTQLWDQTLVRVLDIAHALTTLIHEATSDHGSPTIIDAQLEQGDRRAADDLAERTAHAGWPSAADRLRQLNVLVSRARAAMRERMADDPTVRMDRFELFRRGNYSWFIGVSLLDEYLREWLPQHEPRAGLLDDCLSIVEDGANWAGLAALDICAVKLVGSKEWFGSVLESAETISFLLEGLRRVRTRFGASTTVSLVHFVEPDSSGPGLTHFRIETELEPALACDQFDAFCDEWWDAAVETIGVQIHPVLDVCR